MPQPPQYITVEKQTIYICVRFVKTFIKSSHLFSFKINRDVIFDLYTYRKTLEKINEDININVDF